MNFKPCPQISELAAALRDGQWPIGCDPALRAHVEECSRCAELVLIAEALRQDRAAVIESAALASPGLLWWRAQLLRRQRAMQQVSKPISLAGQVSLGVTILSVIGLVFWQGSQLADWVVICTQFLTRLGAYAVWSQAVGIFPPVLLMLGLGVLGFFGGFALYLVCQRE